MSGRLTPAALTRIRICPAAGLGVEIWTGFRAAAGPLPPSMAIAVICSGIIGGLAGWVRGLASRRFKGSDSPLSGSINRGGEMMLEDPAPPRRMRGQALI